MYGVYCLCVLLLHDDNSTDKAASDSPLFPKACLKHGTVVGLIWDTEGVQGLVWWLIIASSRRSGEPLDSG
jgi:hypothetical protein